MNKVFLKYQKLEIDWLDSMHTSGWIKETEVEPSGEKIIHRTIGYFIKQDKQSLLVCQSYQVFTDIRLIDAIMEIPQKAIIKIIKI